MQGLMLRLAGMLHRRRRLVLAGWAIALVAALPFAARQSDRLSLFVFGSLAAAALPLALGFVSVVITGR
jgi:uncharacterized membrane protein YdfJ with MMPL/SSD domain